MRAVFTKDVLTGLLFLGIAIVAIAVSLPYGWGDYMRIGPAFFPTCVAICLAVIGVVLLIRGASVQVEGFPLRPILLLLAGPIFFALTIHGLGYVLAFAGMTVLGCMAFPRPDWRITAIVVPVLTAVSYLVFVIGLKVNMHLLGSWIGG